MSVCVCVHGKWLVGGFDLDGCEAGEARGDVFVPTSVEFRPSGGVVAVRGRNSDLEFVGIL